MHFMFGQISIYFLDLAQLLLGDRVLVMLLDPALEVIHF